MILMNIVFRIERVEEESVAIACLTPESSWMRVLLAMQWSQG